MRQNIKFYVDINDTLANKKKYNEEVSSVGLSGKELFFAERQNRSDKYVIFYETKDGYEYRPFDNVNGLASGQKARTLEGCVSKAHCMGLFENDTGVAKKFEAPDGRIEVPTKLKEGKTFGYKSDANLPPDLEDTVTDYIMINQDKCEDEGVNLDDLIEFCGFNCSEYVTDIIDFVEEELGYSVV